MVSATHWVGPFLKLHSSSPPTLSDRSGAKGFQKAKDKHDNTGEGCAFAQKQKGIRIYVECSRWLRPQQGHIEWIQLDAEFTVCSSCTYFHGYNLAARTPQQGDLGLTSSAIARRAWSQWVFRVPCIPISAFQQKKLVLKKRWVRVKIEPPKGSEQVLHGLTIASHFGYPHSSKGFNTT